MYDEQVRTKKDTRLAISGTNWLGDELNQVKKNVGVSLRQ